VGEGGITAGNDNFANCKGIYKLTDEQAATKKEKDLKEKEERDLKKQIRADQKAALKAKGKAGLRSTSVAKEKVTTGETKE